MSAGGTSEASGSMTLPRVVLVDDDPMIRRLVAMALDDLPITLVSCASGEEALAALRQAPARLLITDLMMPGMNGHELLERVLAEPSLHAGARLAVFSAGLNPEAQARLAGLPVWRLITKPVSVLTLAETVEEALADGPGDDIAASAAGPQAVATDGSIGEPPDDRPVDARQVPRSLSSSPGKHLPEPDEAAAIRDHFAGQAELFRAFKSSCLVQFRDDLAQGRSAVERRDAPALRRLAHSLKSVLLTLGHPQVSETARRLEHAAAAADWDASLPPWQDLQSALQAWSDQAS